MFIKEKTRYKVIQGSLDDAFSKVEPGIYEIGIAVEGMQKIPFLEKTEDLYNDSKILNAGVFKEVEKYINNFLSPEMEIARKAIKSLNKLGLMLRGKPGTGKTHLVGQLAHKLVKEKQAIVIKTNTFWEYNFPAIINTLRENDKDRFIVIIMDEFEKCKPWHLQDPDLLSFLDGSNSKDNSMILALANDTSELKNFLIDRPGRFEQIYDFDERDDAVLLEMIKSMTPEEYKNRIDADYIVKQLINIKKRTIDAIRLTIRDSIAEIIYFDKHGAFKSFNSLNNYSEKKIGFKNKDEESKTSECKGACKVIQEEKVSFQDCDA